MKTHALILTALLAVVCIGCEKKLELTVYNHSPASRTVQLTTPSDGTMTLGAVNPDSRMTSKVRIPNDDLPCDCRVSAGVGGQSFLVTEDSPKELWFHIGHDGRVTGPYGEHDEYTPGAVQDADVKVRVQQGTVVR